MFCTNCGEQINQNAVTCPKCGCNPTSQNNFCGNCGNKINPESVVCISCGAATKLNQPIQEESSDDTLGCLLGVICFLLPIVGLILYLVWQKKYPQKANSAGLCALIGFIVSFIIGIFTG